MAAFMIRFLISNLFISALIGILLAVKRLLQSSLTGRMQYNLWFLLLGLLAVPFIPAPAARLLPVFSWFEKFSHIVTANTSVTKNALFTDSPTIAHRIEDFTLSVTAGTPSTALVILCGIWIAGILVTLIFLVKSTFRLSTLKKSALPLQNKKVHRLYRQCLNELHITKDIPVYSTAFLNSPIITGLWKPCIYLPIHLISEYHATDMRYILLHELQHYKHRDALGNCLMNTAHVLYWFNPFVWYALEEMRNDREIACDTSVLKMLKKEDYENYGNALINFAQKTSRTPFFLASGISGNIRQLRKRIRNIASYENPSSPKTRKSIAIFVMLTLFMLFVAPTLSTYASDPDRYPWETMSGDISYTDLSAYFEELEGSFVLYDLENNSWNIYDIEHAARRTSPDSTYKIYTALFGLEEDVITPQNSLITWDREIYPFQAWNADQTLDSAMEASVNWYFRQIDRQLGSASVHEHIHQIGYGNENIGGDFDSYWLESSLKISPIEQVRLLTGLYRNDFGFAWENINAVKNSLCLSASETGAFYGKTGTGRVNNQDVNGWFIGYVETPGHTYFFAINITADANASGSRASEIALSILTDMNIRLPLL